MTFEYKIFNLSEVTAAKKKSDSENMITVLNKHGLEGWEVVLRLNDNSFLMKKKIH